MSDQDQPINGFFHQLQRTADQKMDSADLSVAGFFESSLSGTETHKNLVHELIMSVPEHTKIGTNGEWLYGCLTPQVGLDIQCTPSCLRGFKLPDHQGCLYPVWERSPQGFTKLGREGRPQVEHTAYIYGVPADSTLTQLETEILRTEGVKVAILFVPDADTIRYVQSQKIEILPDTDSSKPENSLSSTLSDTSVDPDSPRPCVSKNNFDMKWIVIGVVLLIIIVIVIWGLVSYSGRGSAPASDFDVLTEPRI